jgi:hypothetical protein
MGRRFLALAAGVLVGAGCAAPSGGGTPPASSSFVWLPRGNTLARSCSSGLGQATSTHIFSSSPGECAPYREGEGFDDIELVGGLAVIRESEDFAAWCVSHASMTVHVSQEPGDTFIDDVIRGLEIRNVDLASSS